MALQDGKKYTIAKRRHEVVRLKIAGKSERAIAKELEGRGYKISHGQVHRDWRAELRELADSHSEEADNLRVTQNDRYNELLAAHWEKAQAGDVKAADIVLKIIKGIRDVNGLDLTGRDTTNVNTMAVLNTRANEAAAAKKKLVELLSRKHDAERPVSNGTDSGRDQ